MTVFHPIDAAGVQEAVTASAADGRTLEILGGGSKRALGRPPRTDHVLDLAGLDGIIDYDWAELVLTAKAATSMAEIDLALAERRQMLAFEPVDLRGLLPSQGGPTLGGIVACNLAGPRRVRAGAARDHVLGFAAVNGWGDAWKSGGRVVKNVTGYDMSKLQAGALGTLSVLTEITVRVLPMPDTSCTLALRGLDDAAAIRAMADALNSPNEVSAAAHLPSMAADRAGFGANVPLTILRLEGPRPSVDYRASALQTLLGPALRIEGRESEALWAQVGSVQPLLGRADSLVWRVCPTPSMAQAVLARVALALPSAEPLYDWGGGLLWISLDPGQAGADCGAAIVRGAVDDVGGHATLLRAPEAARAAVAPFHPATGALEALTRRVKASFDPRGTLNPGRMYEGL